jgi:hypothetical protein
MENWILTIILDIFYIPIFLFIIFAGRYCKNESFIIGPYWRAGKPYHEE